MRFGLPSRASFATFTRFKVTILSYFLVKFCPCLNCLKKKISPWNCALFTWVSQWTGSGRYYNKRVPVVSSDPTVSAHVTKRHEMLKSKYAYSEKNLWSLDFFLNIFYCIFNMKQKNNKLGYWSLWVWVLYGVCLPPNDSSLREGAFAQSIEPSSNP